MEKFNKLERFPLGAIKAEGFLKEQMLISKDGISGHLFELEPDMILNPFINKTYVNGWYDDIQDGWGAEISGNYWTGFIQLAFTLNDKELIEKATRWVNNVIKRQRKDGYLGTFDGENADIFNDYNAWGTSCMLRGLLAFFEATGRKDVLDAVHNCLLWFTRVWDGDNKTVYSGPFIIEPLVFTYNYTNDERLKTFAEDYIEYQNEHDIFSNSYGKMLNEPFRYTSNHTAGFGSTVRLPALLYSVNGNKTYLKASEKGIEKVRKNALHISGSPVSVSEYFGPVSANTETEYCSYAFYNASYSYMSYITGDAKYGDYMEEAFYNGAQGARKKDEKAIAYLSAPNQINATEVSSTAVEDMQVYAPCYPTACCPVNAVALLPEFVRGMFLHNEKDIYALCYGPCSLEFEGTKITQETLYPFRNSVKFTVSSKEEFSIFLKIPSWCKGYKITLNKKEIKAEKDAFGYAQVRNSWSGCDIVEIFFNAEIEVIKVDDSHGANKRPIAIKYGALLFAYHIQEDWKPTKGRPMTPLPEGWSWFNVKGKYEQPKGKSSHENIGLRRYAFSWNIALDENLSAKDIEIKEIEPNGYVWSNPPIELHTHCYKAPFLCAPYQRCTFDSYEEYNYVTEKLPLTLVPYGCTNLRITYFPKADLKK